MKKEIIMGIKEGFGVAMCWLLSTSLVALIIQQCIYWVEPNPYNPVERAATIILVIGVGGPLVVLGYRIIRWAWNKF